MSCLPPFDQDEDAHRLAAELKICQLANFEDALLHGLYQGWRKIEQHGDYARWRTGIDALPPVKPSSIDLHTDSVRIGMPDDTDMNDDDLREALMQMHPWRKGPFSFFGMHINTEWRSDWKWQRVAEEIQPLNGRTVLDVGCGSGYHLWRMLGAGAERVIGIDPTQLFCMQFACMKRYMPDAKAWVLPIGVDDMPDTMQAFDTVFSMGILYHRRSPIDHLLQLKGLLRPGGELVLETLIIDGDTDSCLMPHGRYAKMRNVWFIPSVPMLEVWLARAGFSDIRCVDECVTTVEEQRQTAWMQFESLPDFLHPHDSRRTIEGYPAPKRAVLLARAP